MVHQRTLMPKRGPDHAAHCLLFGAKPPQERHAALGWGQPTIGAPRRALISTARTTSNVLLPSALRRPIGAPHTARWPHWLTRSSAGSAATRAVQRRHRYRYRGSIRDLVHPPAPAPRPSPRRCRPEPLLQRSREGATNGVRLPSVASTIWAMVAPRPAAAWRSTAPASSPRGSWPAAPLGDSLAAAGPRREEGARLWGPLRARHPGRSATRGRHHDRLHRPDLGSGRDQRDRAPRRAARQDRTTLQHAAVGPRRRPLRCYRSAGLCIANVT